MVQVDVPSCLLLLLASAVVTVTSAGDTEGSWRRVIMRGGKDIHGHYEISEEAVTGRQPVATQIQLYHQAPTATRLSESQKQLRQKRQTADEAGTATEATAAADVAPPTDTTLTIGPVASAISVSLTSSAASALASVSASFQGQLGALSSQSSADVLAASATVSASASSAFAAVRSSANTAIASATDEANAANSALASATTAAAVASSALASVTTALAAANAALVTATASASAANSALTSATESAKSAVAAASLSASSASSSASSAIASAIANYASLAAGASSAAAAASAGAAASAMSVVQAAQASFSSQISMSTSSASSGGANNLVQPNSAGNADEANTFLVTPSQIAAVVIGTIVGTAILTLLVVYGVMICRRRREKRQRGKYVNGKDRGDRGMDSIDHDDGTGRAEGYSFREEKRRARWSPEWRNRPGKPAATLRQNQTTARRPSLTHRPSLPPLPEESPPRALGGPTVQGPLDGFDFHALTQSPEQSTSGMPEEPAPLKLALLKRRSRGGSQRLAVTRVGAANSPQGGNGSGGDGNSNNNSTLRNSTANPYFSGPLPYRRPSLVRTPSSDTLPRRNSQIPSPLTLNPPLSASTAPRTSTLPWGSWNAESVAWPPPASEQYQALDAQLQPNNQPSEYRGQPQYQRYIPDVSPRNVGTARSSQPSSLQPRQQPVVAFNPRTGHPLGSHPRNSRKTLGPAPPANEYSSSSSLYSPGLLRPVSNLSTSPNSPYSPTFENIPASPSYMSPLSPPPKSPLRLQTLRPTKSEQSLRDTVSPLSSDDDDEGKPSSPKISTPPHSLWRRSKSSSALDGLSYYGLDLTPPDQASGPTGTALVYPPTTIITRPTPTPTPEAASRRALPPPPPSSNDGSSSHYSRPLSNVRPSYYTTRTSSNGGGLFTFLASNDGQTPPEGNEDVASMTPRERRSSSLDRIDIPPEQLTAGGIYVGAPGPRFNLFPRTEAGPSSPLPAVAPPSPVSPRGVTLASERGIRHSTGDIEPRNKGKVGFGLVIR